MIDTTEKQRIWDYMIGVTDHPRQPSPRNPINKDAYLRGHNDGWNACMEHLKAVGKI